MKIDVSRIPYEGISLEADIPAPALDLEIDIIKEEIILSYPIKPLCKVDCKGLCPRCGKNLNEGGCSCAVT